MQRVPAKLSALSLIGQSPFVTADRAPPPTRQDYSQTTDSIGVQLHVSNHCKCNTICVRARTQRLHVRRTCLVVTPTPPVVAVPFFTVGFRCPAALEVLC